ncbi:hypothetical protein [Trichococcus pasteurii]|uniref:Uncharacterized protein n=1 Tax=Trichococcus pasteurii TaxID=43064 RepID=A0A1W1ICV1_9LACT|nr:hypothetical protein [Trichococcus pasteurii]SFE37342.1 hypothetical protein SAMN04488086_10354 [Trichococcus pasteurii]SLM50854.1 Hypothetical protein TPAS_526 [Trichococcus pasteurii]SSB91735.1 Hypothetical protein TPAS_526 [Trichococcus pasteurii]
MRDHKSRLNFIPTLLEQVLDNTDRIGSLVADAESAESIDLLKRETEKLSARNENLLHLIANLLEEEQHKHPRAAPKAEGMLIY